VFRSVALPEVQARLADPSDCLTFERCKLDLSEHAQHPRSVREAHNHLGRHVEEGTAGLALRNAKTRTHEVLVQAIRAVPQTVTPSGCQGF
jgi:hypothetical protein